MKKSYTDILTSPYPSSPVPTAFCREWSRVCPGARIWASSTCCRCSSAVVCSRAVVPSSRGVQGLSPHAPWTQEAHTLSEALYTASKPHCSLFLYLLREVYRMVLGLRKTGLIVLLAIAA